MKKRNIVKKSRDFERIISNKRPFKNEHFLLFIEDHDDQVYRFGISISKKIKKAVVRNRIKRQIKNILDEYKKEFKKTFNCIIIVDMNVLKLKYNKIKESLTKLIKKAKLIEEVDNEKK
ncbi:MAG: ribonuclease P protein component [Bacilli bacterium]